MTIEIYTDGSFHPHYNTCGWAFLAVVRGETSCIEAGASRSMRTSQEAEVMAATKAISYVNSKYSFNERIDLTLVVDSDFVAEAIQRIGDPRNQPKQGYVAPLYEAFNEYVGRFGRDLKLKVIKSHADGGKENRYVDRIAKQQSIDLWRRNNL